VEINGVDINNLGGLSALTLIGGNLHIYGNDSLVNLVGLENLSAIYGDLIISRNHALQDLSGLESVSYVGGNIAVNVNDGLTSLTGLENLTSIGDYLGIWGNDDLTSLNGLNNLSSIGDYLQISDNDSLTSLAGLNNLTSVGSHLKISGNNTIINLSGLDNIDPESLSGLFIEYNPLLSNCAIESICEYLALPNGNIEIHHNDSGCNSEEEIDSACVFLSVANMPSGTNCQVSPNPTGGIVNFQFSITDFQRVTIKIYDLLDRGMETLVDEVLPAGEHVVKFDTRQLAPGIYIYLISHLDYG
jgi:hypothetical protein